MIIRVWGIVNSAEVEFTPVRDRPGYWEGLAPWTPGLQDMEIWAENDKGARGHLQCTVQVQYRTETYAKLVLLPYIAELVEQYAAKLAPDILKSYLHACRKAVD